MVHLLIAYADHKISSKPNALYIGNDGVELQEIANKNAGKFQRFERHVLNQGIKVGAVAPKTESKHESKKDKK